MNLPSSSLPLQHPFFCNNQFLEILNLLLGKQKRMEERKRQPPRCIEDDLGPFALGVKELVFGPDNSLAAKVSRLIQINFLFLTCKSFKGVGHRQREQPDSLYSWYIFFFGLSLLLHHRCLNSSIHSLFKLYQAGWITLQAGVRLPLTSKTITIWCALIYLVPSSHLHASSLSI